VPGAEIRFYRHFEDGYVAVIYMIHG
jgi:hypothetical protein